MDQELEEIVSEESSSSKDVENETNRKISGGRTLDEFRELCGPFLQAARQGDWSAAKAFLEEYPDCVGAPITKEEGTALHVAVIAQRTTFIKELLKLMTPDDLESKNEYGFTALHCAVQSGSVIIAWQLVQIHKKLLLIPENAGDVPLNVAVYLGHANMVLNLLSVTPLEQLTEENYTELLLRTIYYDMYDIALKILEINPNIVTVTTECGWRALEILARKPFAIGSESQLSFWKIRINSWFKRIYNKALVKTLAYQLVEQLWKMVGSPYEQVSSNLDHSRITSVFEAAKVGNVEFIIIVASLYPDILWQLDENGMSIFHIAIKYRHEGFFGLIYEIGASKYNIVSCCTLDTKENMLHLVGHLAPLDQLNIISGEALQMQRECMWFKEIEKIVPLSHMNMKNVNGKTPKEIFLEEHANLQKYGEKWMKETSNYCMVVATLITTVVFAAALTVPGGNKQEIGTPIFLRSNWFMVFLISDAIAMCSSSTSIIIFLSMFSSCYKEVDFLVSIPSKLVVGLGTLFISIVGIMVAFSATCFLMYSSGRAWLPVFVLAGAIIPITSFVLLHLTIWFATYFATYDSRFFFRSRKQRFI